MGVHHLLLTPATSQVSTRSRLIQRKKTQGVRLDFIAIHWAFFPRTSNGKKRKPLFALLNAQTDPSSRYHTHDPI